MRISQRAWIVLTGLLVAPSGCSRQTAGGGDPIPGGVGRPPSSGLAGTQPGAGGVAPTPAGTGGGAAGVDLPPPGGGTPNPPLGGGGGTLNPPAGMGGVGGMTNPPGMAGLGGVAGSPPLGGSGGSAGTGTPPPVGGMGGAAGTPGQPMAGFGGVGGTPPPFAGMGGMTNPPPLAGMGGIGGTLPPFAGAGGAGGTGTPPPIAGTSGAAGIRPPPPPCAGEQVMAEVAPVGIYLMLDISGSMDQTVHGSNLSKWASVQQAMSSFVHDPRSAGLQVGLQYFPGSECDPQQYAIPAVPILPLPPNAPALDASIRNTSAGGGTPMGPALEGALLGALQWQLAHPKHPSVVVLATDGEPTQCISQGYDMPRIQQLARNALNSPTPIKTYVIGVFEASNGASIADMHQLARDGGTGQAFIVDPSGNFVQKFLDAMTMIRGSLGLSCTFQIPVPQSGLPVDFRRVNVKYTDPMGVTQTLMYVPDGQACGPAGQAWHYDQDPATGATPTRIVMCNSICNALQTLIAGSIKIEVGCKTVS